MPTQSHFDFSYSSVVSAMHQRPIFFLFAHIKKKFIVEQEVDGKTGTLSLRGKRKSMKYSKKIFNTLGQPLCSLSLSFLLQKMGMKAASRKLETLQGDTVYKTHIHSFNN